LRVERTLGTSFFEQGFVEIEGWIPTRLSGAVLMPTGDLPKEMMPNLLLSTERDGDVVRFHLQTPHRQESYESGIVAGMREMVRKHRDPWYQMTVHMDDVRSSLALALACQEAAVGQTRIDLSASD
jgi:hypothetical protein